MKLESVLATLGEERRIHYALDRFEAALKAVGNPEKCVNTLIVAGTNGKGTTALYLSSILREAGHKVGTYLSPHLQHLNERFVSDLKCAPESELDEIAAELASIGKKFELSYFEFLTLTYFAWAKRKQFDFSVLEVGLGGRLDATNVTNSISCVIPSLDFDHQSYLGSTLEEILSEKLGILRPESLLFTGVRDSQLMKQIEHRCMELDAIYYYSKDLNIQTEHVDWAGQSVTVNGFPLNMHNPSVGALENAALSQMLMRIVFPKITAEQIRLGIEKVKTPGRMEVMQENPRVVLSGDHNPAGVRCLLSTLDRLKAGKPNIVCAFSPDKPSKQMFETLQGAANEIVQTEIRDPFKAMEEMLARTMKDETLLITGSLYLVGQVRKLWSERVSYL